MKKFIISGNFPTIADGILETTACVKHLEDCDQSTDICIRRCGSSNNEYNVYYLTTPAQVISRYCFGKYIN